MATIKLEVDSNELREMFWGSGFESDPVTRNWLMRAEYLGNTKWDKIGKVRLWYIPEDGDYEDDKYWSEDYQEHCHSKDVSLEDIEDALSFSMNKPYYHVPCGGRIDTDFERWDSCVTALLLQVMVYGKEVYA